MKKYLFCVKDTVSGEFYPPQAYTNQAVAERAFDKLCTDSQLGCDLQLYCVGTYDTETGLITPEFNYVKGGAL